MNFRREDLMLVDPDWLAFMLISGGSKVGGKEWGGMLKVGFEMVDAKHDTSSGQD